MINIKTIKVVSHILLMIVVCSLLSGCGESWTAKSEHIITNYIRDEKASQERYYKQKDMKISGKVISKRQFDNSNIYAVKVAEEQVGDLDYRLFLAIDDSKLANSINIGDNVVAEGVFYGLVPQESPEKKYLLMKVNKIKW